MASTPPLQLDKLAIGQSTVKKTTQRASIGDSSSAAATAATPNDLQKSASQRRGDAEEGEGADNTSALTADVSATVAAVDYQMAEKVRSLEAQLAHTQEHAAAMEATFLRRSAVCRGEIASMLKERHYMQAGLIDPTAPGADGISRYVNFIFALTDAKTLEEVDIRTEEAQIVTSAADPQQGKLLLGASTADMASSLDRLVELRVERDRLRHQLEVLGARYRMLVEQRTADTIAHNRIAKQLKYRHIELERRLTLGTDENKRLREHNAELRQELRRVRTDQIALERATAAERELLGTQVASLQCELQAEVLRRDGAIATALADSTTGASPSSPTSTALPNASVETACDIYISDNVTLRNPNRELIERLLRECEMTTDDAFVAASAARALKMRVASTSEENAIWRAVAVAAQAARRKADTHAALAESELGRVVAAARDRNIDLPLDPQVARAKAEHYTLADERANFREMTRTLRAELLEARKRVSNIISDLEPLVIPPEARAPMPLAGDVSDHHRPGSSLIDELERLEKLEIDLRQSLVDKTVQRKAAQRDLHVCQERLQFERQQWTRQWRILLDGLPPEIAAAIASDGVSALAADEVIEALVAEVERSRAEMRDRAVAAVREAEAAILAEKPTTEERSCSPIPELLSMSFESDADSEIIGGDRTSNVALGGSTLLIPTNRTPRRRSSHRLSTLLPKEFVPAERPPPGRTAATQTDMYLVTAMYNTIAPDDSASAALGATIGSVSPLPHELVQPVRSPGDGAPAFLTQDNGSDGGSFTKKKTFGEMGVQVRIVDETCDAMTNTLNVDTHSRRVQATVTTADACVDRVPDVQIRGTQAGRKIYTMDCHVQTGSGRLPRSVECQATPVVKTAFCGADEVERGTAMASQTHLSGDVEPARELPSLFKNVWESEAQTVLRMDDIRQPPPCAVAMQTDPPANRSAILQTDAIESLSRSAQTPTVTTKDMASLAVCKTATADAQTRGFMFGAPSRGQQTDISPGDAGLRHVGTQRGRPLVSSASQCAGSGAPFGDAGTEGSISRPLSATSSAKKRPATPPGGKPPRPSTAQTRKLVASLGDTMSFSDDYDQRVAQLWQEAELAGSFGDTVRIRKMLPILSISAPATSELATASHLAHQLAALLNVGLLYAASPLRNAAASVGLDGASSAETMHLPTALRQLPLFVFQCVTLAEALLTDLRVQQRTLQLPFFSVNRIPLPSAQRLRGVSSGQQKQQPHRLHCGVIKEDGSDGSSLPSNRSTSAAEGPRSLLPPLRDDIKAKLLATMTAGDSGAGTPGTGRTTAGSGGEGLCDGLRGSGDPAIVYQHDEHATVRCGAQDDAAEEALPCHSGDPADPASASSSRMTSGRARFTGVDGTGALNPHVAGGAAAARDSRPPSGSIRVPSPLFASGHYLAACSDARPMSASLLGMSQGSLYFNATDGGNGTGAATPYAGQSPATFTQQNAGLGQNGQHQPSATDRFVYALATQQEHTVFNGDDSASFLGSTSLLSPLPSASVRRTPLMMAGALPPPPPPRGSAGSASISSSPAGASSSGKPLLPGARRLETMAATAPSQTSTTTPPPYDSSSQSFTGGVPLKAGQRPPLPRLQPGDEGRARLLARSLSPPMPMRQASLSRALQLAGQHLPGPRTQHAAAAGHAQAMTAIRSDADQLAIRQAFLQRFGNQQR